MSFQNQGFWMAKGADSVNDSDVNYDSSRIELKRSHQWFMDGSEAELYFNKKQAVGVPTSNLFSGMINSNISPWGNPSNFHSISDHFSERLFVSDTARASNYDDRNIPLVNSERVNMEKKVNEDPFGNDSSFNLSMSHTLEDPRSRLSYGGIRKVKVSQVKESENIMPLSAEDGYSRVDNNNTMSTSHAYEKSENTISTGLAYNKGDAHIISVGETFDRESNIFISMGQPYSKTDDSISMSQTYKDNNNIMAMCQTFSKGDNIISMGQTYKPDENTISMGHLFSKGCDSTVLMSQSYIKGDNYNLSIGQSFNKGESTIISFGGHDDDDTNPSGQLISNYDLLMAQSTFQSSEVINEKEVVNSNVEALASAVHATVSGTENGSKKKEDLKTSKKAPPNNFPSNVRSLLSTGMLDGVPVKYIAWSREKELRGVIKDSGYLCGCQTCNFSKVINAYEFERHANCKTKHPNNHIYFENGKTIYGIVQELRSTPQSMLFEVIQTITGSPINQKSFRLWKESFLAATRELQRIYGKDGGKIL
ncbi:uncharacterized protein LOC110620831 isoform X1 [Manihot esculenta]|uniref:Tify domain-containing protein n=5 Tax=Manihot esculenta TaxID=3983 RepID=A0A251KC47_MANES|nr:uncharacterized protein LOC110620831 isoform X1 [Manihot esculenta]XP_021620430.1 uncharacterized protein LOC110620831 isoform X1 [Manihot esculenta]XP_021620431.1 uncharacterized protein LOC110620831 isoform X1 [Manihot esculenta]XP_043814977.1 uncharacterized protein LOC110620831 isoform X1 [Manihot esculenta]XP_043814978.1 uncharacterized protein LOC110620831 isoform X1 [Manihot esculenta]KAG8649256.1 hypothetical protein MANES_08G077300v8 [Manihot esculenta]KAG8649257.1 hypothetical pr